MALKALLFTLSRKEESIRVKKIKISKRVLKVLLRKSHF